MNSKPILNREIVTPWHVEVQMAERKDVVKAQKQSWHTYVTIDSLTILDTEHIKHQFPKNRARIHHLWQYLMQCPMVPQAKRNYNQIRFVVNSVLNFFADLRVRTRVCVWKFPKSSVTGLSHWTAVARCETKNCNCFLSGTGVCQPWIREVECLTLYFEHIELPAKPLDYFLRSNKSNIDQSLLETLTLGTLRATIGLQNKSEFCSTSII